MSISFDLKLNKHRIVTGILAILSPVALYSAQSVTIEGSGMKVLEYEPETSTGLNKIFVVYDTNGVNIVYHGTNCINAKAYRYSNLGGGYAEEINNIETTTSTLTIPSPSGDMGYIIEEGTTRYYFWLTDYSKHKFELNSLSVSDESDCSYSVLDFEGDASQITYYTINGQPKVLSREIYIDYTTQEFNRSINEFSNTDVRKVYESVGSRISITPPAYCATYFTIEGDRFLRDWGMAIEGETTVAEPIAVDCRTEVEQEKTESEEGSNVMHGDNAGLGGSAPAEINFYAYTTEGVLHYEWQMSRDSEFNNPDYRFNQKDLSYTFTDEGTFYLRFIASNADGTCEAFSDVYTVSIGASELECPNAFSPNDDGVNDVWKVSYRSLIDFHCEIFNRNGQKIIGFDSPDQGWDGTWHGKKVKPGVYYYVITATGADGKNYKKSGDINIINSVNYGTSTGGSIDSGY